MKFSDDAWPYARLSATGVASTARELALTTLSLDPANGKIESGALELNTHDYHFFITDHGLDSGEAGSYDAYDLEFVLTHELGHVLGLAHSTIEGAVMSPQTRPGLRDPTLTDDDRAAVCAIYLPDGFRSVDHSIVPGGRWAREPCAVSTDGCIETASATAGCSTTSDRRRYDDVASAGAIVVGAAIALAVRGRRRARGKRLSQSIRNSAPS